MALGVPILKHFRVKSVLYDYKRKVNGFSIMFFHHFHIGKTMYVNPGGCLIYPNQKHDSKSES